MRLSKKKRIEVLETKVRSLESRMEFHWKVLMEQRVKKETPLPGNNDASTNTKDKCV